MTKTTLDFHKKLYITIFYKQYNFQNKSQVFELFINIFDILVFSINVDKKCYSFEIPENLMMKIIYSNNIKIN